MPTMSIIRSHSSVETCVSKFIGVVDQGKQGRVVMVVHIPHPTSYYKAECKASHSCLTQRVDGMVVVVASEAA